MIRKTYQFHTSDAQVIVKAYGLLFPQVLIILVGPKSFPRTVSIVYSFSVKLKYVLLVK